MSKKSRFMTEISTLLITSLLINCAVNRNSSSHKREKMSKSSESLEKIVNYENSIYLSATGISLENTEIGIKPLRKTLEGDLSYVEYIPNNQKRDNVLLYLNGLLSHSSWFAPVACLLGKEGIKTYALDRRGSGINSIITGSGKDWLDDLESLVERVSEENPNARIHLASLCFGSRIAGAYDSDRNKNKKISSQVMISPGFSMKVRPTKRESFLCWISSLTKCDNIVIKSPVYNEELFSDNEGIISAIKKDNLKISYPRARDVYSGYALMKKIKFEKLNSPILVLYSERDEIVDYSKVFDMLSKANTDVFYRNYEKNKHALTLENPQQVSKDILKWIENYR
ncbi:MAG: alpha/beta fold hydrolase [Nanoarchaeota archaeon]